MNTIWNLCLPRGSQSNRGVKTVRTRVHRNRPVLDAETLEGRQLLATLYGVTGAGNLIQIDSATPGTIASTTAITGLGAGETILGVDTRPSDRQLYALTTDAGNVGRIYSINPATAVATPVSTVSVPLSGAQFGVNFDPTADRLAVVGNTGQNLLIDVVSGTATAGTPLAYAAGDTNFGTAPQVGGASFTNAFNGATTTSLYDIDTNLGTLALQNPASGGALTTVGPLGVSPSSVLGFDILSTGVPTNDTAYASLNVGGSTGLYSINLATGAATLVGTIGAGATPVFGLAAAPAALPGASIDNVSMNEGNSGTTNFVFTVTLSAASPSTVTIPFSTADNTAIAGTDYTSTTGTLTFAPGTTTQTITVPVNANTIIQPDRSFFVNLGAATNATVSTGQGTGTILDDDSTFQFTTSAINVNEDAGNATLTVTRTALGALARAATVNFATSDGTAVAGVPGALQDYLATSGTLSFTPGVTSQTINIPLNNEPSIEPTETFNVTLSAPTGPATLGTTTAAIVSILDTTNRDLSIGNTSVVRGSTGTTNAVFTVNLNAPSSFPITVNYATADGTGVAGTDYTTTSGTLTFAPGTTTQTISVPIVNSATFQPNKTFFVNLSNPTGNAVIEQAQGTATILDANTPVTGQFAPVVAVEGQPFTGTLATFTDPTGTGATSSYTATVNFGDGSAPVTLPASGITSAGNTFTIAGTHTFPEEGTFPISITVVGSGGRTTVISGVATVTDAPLTAGAAQTVASTVGTPLGSSAIGTFTDTGGPEAASSYDATINWGDGSGTSVGVVTVSGSTFTVSGGHSFLAPGTYNGSIRVRDDGGATTTIPFTATATAPVLTCSAMTVTEGQLLNNVVVATLTGVTGSPTPTASYYAATIDWGDGTAPTPGFVQAGTGGGPANVLGSHMYAEAGTYPVRVTLAAAGNNNVVTSTCSQVVNDVPITITGSLNTASDTGVSNTDGITNNNTPTFTGTSEPGSVVTLNALTSSGGSVRTIPLGQAVTDAGGRWTLTSALIPDGTYVVTASAVDRNGNTRGFFQILPNATTSFLIVDTVGPKVNDVVFDRLNGRIGIAFQDNLSGLDQRSVIDGSNYSFTGRSLHVARTPRFFVTNLSATPVTSPTGVQDVTLTLNGGTAIRGGHYTFTIFSGGLNDARGIRDVAGNPLDGEFYGYFPSGNNQRGGDFVAGLDAVHNTVFGLVPVQNGFATPNNPPGTPAQPITIGTGLLGGGGTTQTPRTRKHALAVPKGPAVHHTAVKAPASSAARRHG